MSAPPSVTEFQVEVARAFFALDEAQSFLLAGGLALLAHGMSDRPTQDMDAFTSVPGDVQRALVAFERVAGDRGWTVEVRQSSDTFVRLQVSGEDALLVDLALDSPPGLPASVSVLGPTFDPEELAARKLLALFDRAMPRDFADVYVLARSRSRDDVLSLARALDPGLDATVLAVAMRRVRAYRDEDIPIDGARLEELREFFAAWAEDLDEHGSSAAARETSSG